MERYIVFFLILTTQINFAQNTSPFPVSGNVGIGTTAPLYRLHLSGYHNDSQILLHSLGGGDDARQADLMLWSSEPEVSYSGVGIGNNVAVSTSRGMHLLNIIRGGSYLRLLDNSMSFGIVSSSGVNKEVLTLDTQGNAGFGTNSPVSKLSIAGSLTINGGLTNTLARPSITSKTLLTGEIRGYSNSGNDYDDGFLRISAGGGTTPGIKSYIDLAGYSTVPDMNGNIVFGTSGSERMRIDRNGYIGIGTSSPDSKLAVNGTIHSKEVKVDMNGWSDFVFKKEYNLPTLQEVEKHINKKGHLEDIPSEEEVLKNGINLGEMNAKFLQKIEELTLYLIQQEKKNTVQTLEIENFKNEIANSKNEIETLKKENESFKNILDRLSKIEEKLK
ncbi:hypothetical protein [Flavobacterium sp. Root420]|uniref:hypothetical protein n=1 Tax=Flavobacterium sp. Root420 TaxID=1736533 RepID=UPI0006FC133E|nr:hypothetical protein [Flavobacterium sp. Root420]KQW99227.1 hypothetical protein ASC72_09045 [Flavobacterium sp. Root420]